MADLLVVLVLFDQVMSSILILYEMEKSLCSIRLLTMDWRSCFRCIYQVAQLLCLPRWIEVEPPVDPLTRSSGDYRSDLYFKVWKMYSDTKIYKTAVTQSIDAT
mgnify:FL=1